MFSFQSYGIDYADSYPLTQPRFTKISILNIYMHRFKNFHQAPQVKFFYDCVRIKKPNFEINIIQNSCLDYLCFFPATFLLCATI
jgi:hypothetical protein